MGSTLKKFSPIGPEVRVLTESPLVETLISNAKIFVFSYSPKYRTLLSWSDNSKEILGVTETAIAHDSNLFLRYVHPDDRYLLLTQLEQALKGEIPYRVTYRWIRPDNNCLRWLHCRAALIKEGNEEFFEGLIIDVSEDLMVEIGQFTGPYSVSNILDAFSTMVFIVDRDLRILKINKSKLINTFDFGDADFKRENFKVGKSLLDALSDERIKNEYNDIFTDLLEERLKYHQRRIAANNLVYNVEITPIKVQHATDGLLFNISDITSSVVLENELAHLKKLEGMGVLAEGVGHHLNNLLQAILGEATIIANHPTKKALVSQAAQSIIDAVSKTSGLTRELIVLSEKSASRKAYIDLNLATMAAINNVQDMFSSGIKVSVAFGNLPKIKADQNQLIEAVEALLRNAKESFVGNKQKSANISIKTHLVDLKLGQITDLPQGSYARLAITDSGPGMTEETKKRCFDPFYTTKQLDPETGLPRKSSGLGLPKAFSIITKFGGTITVDSKHGFGTTVSVYLPVKGTYTKNINTDRDKLSACDKPRIMVIDDDPMVLNTVKAMILDFGYQCIAVNEPKQALSLLKEHQKTLEIVLLDAVMPTMDGSAVLRQINRINKKVKVIGFSGAAPQQTKPLLQLGAVTVLKKPILPDELKRAIDMVLKEGKMAANI